MTLLYIILSAIIGAALYSVLLAPKAPEVPEEAEPKRKRHEPEYVTHEQLREAIDNSTKELTYEWNEWYEKFDKLHLRLAKREKRAKTATAVEQEEQSEEIGARPSVLHFRRVGSV